MNYFFFLEQSRTKTPSAWIQNLAPNVSGASNTSYMAKFQLIVNLCFLMTFPLMFYKKIMLITPLLFVPFDLQRVLKAAGIFAGSIFLMRNFGDLMVI